MWGRKRSNLDRREEARAHIRLEADELQAEGLTPEEALSTARARFGYSPHLDPVGSGLGPSWLSILVRDIRYAARQLGASPISTITILASLVIGIGAGTAIFSLADQALVRALPVEAPQELVQLEWVGDFVGGGRGYGSLIPHPLFLDLREAQQVFEELAARSPGEVNAIVGSGTERVRVELVTGSYFRMLGVQPFLGRLFTEEDDKVPGAHQVVILSHGYWQSRFGGEAAVIGRQMRINARPMTIVGVAPSGFHGTDWSAVPALWMPMMMNDLVHEWGRLPERRVRFQHVYARLAPGISGQQAEAALQPWFQRYLRADMTREGWPAGVEVATIDRYLASRLAVRPGGQGQAARGNGLRQPMLILTTATGLLLVLSCLNVANLSLAKAAARRRDTALRIALGASRRRVMFERLVEAGLVATVGGAAGLLFAPTIGRWILSYLRLGGGADLALTPALDGRTLATALGIAVVATLLSGLGPAWFAAGSNPMGALKTLARGSSGGFGLRKALVIGQVCLALVFLVGAGLFGETLRSLRATGPGFATEHLLTFTVAPTNDGYEPAESKRVLRRILDEVQGLSGVSAAAVGVWPLLEGGGWGNPVLVDGARRFETEDSLPMNAVSPGFFEVLGVDLVLGRDFDSRDVSNDGWNLRTAIVTEEFVERYLPGENPIGVRIDFGGDASRAARMEIVGVVRGYREQALRDPRPPVFFPIWERPAATGTFYVRTRVSFETVAPEILAVVERIDPLLAVTAVRTLDEQIDRLLVSERILAALGRVFALFATSLAMIGVYGVQSFSAARRRKEIGIRVALGAPRHNAAGLIVGEALRLGVLGVGFALPIVWGLSRLVESQLYGVETSRTPVLISAVLIVLLVCVAASVAPARRAAAVDPLEMLRVD